MERPGPLQRCGRRSHRTLRGSIAPHCGDDDGLGPTTHLLRCPTTESQQQHSPRIDPANNELANAVSEGQGLFGAGAGDDQQGRGGALLPSTILACYNTLWRHRGALVAPDGTIVPPRV
jgi:hypothetical protein